MTEDALEAATDESEIPPLVEASDLTDFAGAPFATSVVAAAAASVRSEAEWHIAPVITETVRLDCAGGPLLLLPTHRVVEVAEVRDVTGTTPTVLEGWRKSRKGMLYRAGGWPRGFEAVEVDLTHGYRSCPAELLSVIGDRAAAVVRDVAVTQESSGAESVSYSSAAAYLETLSASPEVRRYKLQWGA